MELFLDTNIFLHCKPVQEINWSRVVGDATRIKLMVTMAVVGELDKRKTDSNKGKVKRAKNALKFLEDKFPEAELSSDLSIKIFDESALHDRNQDRSWVDDYLIQTVLNYNNSNPISAKVVTQDSTMKMKCLARGIQVYVIPEEFLLENDDDDQAKEIKKLQQEINLLKNNIPKVSFSFAGKSTFYEVKLKVFDFAEYCNQLVWELRDANWMHENATTWDLMTPSIGNPKITHDAKAYNGKLQHWLNKYHQFLQKHQDEIIRSQMCFQLEFEIVNSGTSPADGLEIELLFPDTLHAGVNKYEFDVEPPQMPAKPGTQTFSDVPSYFRGINPEIHELSFVNRDKEPWVDYNNSHLIRFSFKDLMHKKPIKLDPVFISFDNFERIKGFSIYYRIYAKNMRDHLEGQLNVSVHLER